MCPKEGPKGQHGPQVGPTGLTSPWLLSRSVLFSNGSRSTSCGGSALGCDTLTDSQSDSTPRWAPAERWRRERKSCCFPLHTCL